ncbi:Hypothetical protein NTJ_13182 [Nesidiocoris tenuis]|uniref:Uncharacterized protein n=1 Tax=Nesidiocoris tenuis TaxID=355587 RepID=A0ABN7B9S0_9HEMI|nr:Hypothetical protein NTJ_13182 [Nesidiocoris tenuis]
MSHIWLIVVTLASLAYAHPTIYKMNEDELLSPVLVPVSSTVIPLPIYKVSSSLTRQRAEADFENPHPTGPKLITVKTKKVKKDKVGASVKAITHQEWNERS